MSLSSLPFRALNGLIDTIGAGGGFEGGGTGLLAPRRGRSRGRPASEQPGRNGRDGRRRPAGRRRPRWGRRLALLLLVPTLLFGVMIVAFAAGNEPEIPATFGASPEALADIPADFLALYQEAASAEGIDWAVLAGIGKLECDHGRSTLAGCDPPGTVNSAGARGPMQFLGSTWRASAGRYARDVAGPPIARGQEHRGYATDGDGDGIADPWSAADAIHAAARYLVHHGAPEDYDGAVLAYNHSNVYLRDVLQWADTYRDASATATAAAASTADPGGPVELTTVRGITVHSAIAQPLGAMLAAAEADGVSLTGSGYRSSERQIELRRQHCGTSDYAIYEMPSSQCSPPTARPGNSMHERGLAIDFENCSSQSTACYGWLNTNAAAYGFYNLPSEPWHWSIDGT